MNTEFERFVSPGNFQLAWRRVRNSRRLEVKDRLSLKVFSSSLDQHLKTLIEDVQKEFSPSGTPYIYIPKKSKTLRPFAFLSMRDRLIYQALGNIVAEQAFPDLSIYADLRVFSPVIDDPQSDFLFRPNPSHNGRLGQFEKFSNAIHEAQRDVENFNYYVKADIAAFYPSVDHTLLIDCLLSHEWLTDERLLNLLQKCLLNWSAPLDAPKFQQGIPIGYETSDLLANLFLFEIDQQAEHFCYMLRFVDDMHFFTPSKEEAVHALANIDLLLQKRALHLQTSKVEIVENTNPEAEKEEPFVIKFQAALSSIDFWLNQSSVGALQKSEDKLLDLIRTVCKPGNYTNPLDYFTAEKLQNVEAIIAFVLYRLEEKEYWIRNLALYLLDELPSRCFSITQYLGHFEDDDEVINKLYDISVDERHFAHVRSNCLQTLVRIGFDSETVRQVARQWSAYSEEWILRITGISILQNYLEEFEFLWELVEHEVEDHARASILVACYQLGTLQQKAEVVNRTVFDKSYVVQSLGAYLLLNYPQVGLSTLRDLNAIPPRMRRLDGELPSSRERTIVFQKELQQLCGFEVNERLPLQEIFGDVSIATDLLSKAFYAKETNANEFVSSIVEFTTQIARATVKHLGTDLRGLLSVTIVQNLQQLGEDFGNLPESLNRASILSDTKQAIKIQDVPHLLENAALALAIVFVAFHDFWQLQKPETLIVKTRNTQFAISALPEQKLANKEANREPIKIFVSYAHEDETLKKKLVGHLAFLKITGQAEIWDDRKIPAGDLWFEEIDTHLQSAEIVMFLISSAFLNSVFISSHEVPLTMRRYHNGECKVIPVILKSVVWEFDPYNQFQALPKDGKAIILWRSVDEGCKNVAEGMGRLISSL